MRTLAMARNVTLAAALAVTVGACSQDLVQTPSRNLDRPTDIAFVCMTEPDGGTAPSPVDPARCAIDPDAGLPSAKLYGFVTNTARGEVALVDIGLNTTIHLVDLDPMQPGYGFIPVGKLPTRISSSSDGCRAATANSGTCDLSVIDTEVAVTPALLGTATVGDGGLTVPRGTVARVVPRTAIGPLGARPREIAIVPSGEPDTCAVDTVYQAVVTFPRCGLVALLELPTGRVIDSVKLTAEGPVVTGSAPWCPAECGAGSPEPPEDAGAADAAADAAADDAGTVDGGDDAGAGGDDAGAGGDDAGAGGDDGGVPQLAGAATTGGLAVSADGKRIYVGAGDQPLVFALGLDAGALTVLPNPTRLDSTGAGVRRLRLSPFLTFGDVTQSFLYAFAGDDSVHVVLAQQVSGDATSDEMVECETNPDPRIWVDEHGKPAGIIALEKRGCVRLDGHPPRRPLLTTPGITLPAGVPKDVAFQTLTSYQLSQRPSTTAAGPTNLKGTFGWLGISRGTAALINLLPDRQAGESGYGESGNGYTLRPDPSLLLAHQIRNADDITTPLTESSIGSLVQNSGPPRVYTMARLADGLSYPRADAFRIDDAHASDGQIATTIDQVYQDCKSLYDFCFPDVEAVQSESWNFTFRGTLPGSLRSTGNIDDAGWALEDRSQVFCDLGTAPGDLLLLTGCVVDSQCAIGEVCVTDPVAPSAVTGLCFPQADAEAKRTECFGFISSVRQYRVSHAYADRLEVVPSYEIRHLPGGCDPSLGESEHERCNVAAPTDYPTIDPAVEHFLCEPVPWQSGAPGQCVRECTGDLPCGDGYLCDVSSRRCVAGPALTGEAKRACLSELANYAIQVGDGYSVVGNYQGTSVTGFLHRVRRADQSDATGHYPCVDALATTTDPTERQRLLLKQGRIPLLPPLCNVDASGHLPPDYWPPDPNPCRVEGTGCPEGETTCGQQYRFSDAAGNDVFAQDGRAVRVYFANPIINVGFMIGRNDATEGRIVNPPPSTNYYIQADVAGWYQPFGVALSAYLPETVMAGPDGYIYIVDSGLDATSTGLRGQLLRIDPVTSNIDTNFVVR